MGLIKEFKSFAVQGNVFDLAVGVIIGTAFGKIVSSLVDDILMPIFNPIIPGGNWKELVIGPDIKIGSFLSIVVNFLIISFIIFLAIKAINLIRKNQEDALNESNKTSEPSKEEILLTEIRDILKERKG